MKAVVTFHKLSQRSAALFAFLLCCARLVEEEREREPSPMNATTRRSLRTEVRKAGRIVVIIGVMIGMVSGETTMASAQNAPAQTVRLERGQVLVMSLNTPVDSGSAKIGDRVELRLVRPLTSGDDIVAPVGWIVPAHITKVSRAGKRNCRDGNVAWKLEALTLPNGTKVRLVRLNWLPYRNGRPADIVHVRSAGENVGKVAEYVTLAPLFAYYLLVFSPSGLAMAWREGEPCGGQPGAERRIPVGTLAYAAIAREVRVTPEPATAH